MTCQTDYECKVDHFCWYRSPVDAKEKRKTCMKLYKADLFEEFGWAFVSENEKYTIEDYT